MLSLLSSKALLFLFFNFLEIKFHIFKQFLKNKILYKNIKSAFRKLQRTEVIKGERLLWQLMQI